jgi:hypothetical protein
VNPLGGVLIVLGLLVLAGTTMPYGLVIVAALGAILATS